LKLTKKDRRSKLEKEIDLILDEMRGIEATTSEYLIRLNNLERLHKMNNEIKNRKVKPDTIAIVMTNLIGIGMILGYERVNIITSKALGFVLRGRV